MERYNEMRRATPCLTMPPCPLTSENRLMAQRASWPSPHSAQSGFVAKLATVSLLIDQALAVHSHYHRSLFPLSFLPSSSSRLHLPQLPWFWSLHSSSGIILSQLSFDTASCDCNLSLQLPYTLLGPLQPPFRPYSATLRTLILQRADPLPLCISQDHT